MLGMTRTGGRRSAGVALLGLAVACRGEAPKVEEGGCADGAELQDWYVDGDGDGYGDAAQVLVSCTRPEGHVGNDLDCDDGDVRYHPGAPETDCEDPADYNCDGSVAFADVDEDGVPACQDCDDGDAARAPGLTEVCDGVDNDCNLVVDYPAVDAPTWSIDYDDDGYGRPDADFQIEACDAPAGFVDNSDDCDDTDPADFPGAYTAFPDADGDGYGAGTAVEVCELDETISLDSSDCDDAAADINPGVVEICNDGIDQDCTPDSPCEGAFGLAAATLSGLQADGYLGADLVGVGDVTGDGVDDLAVAATGFDGGGEASGAVWVFAGPLAPGDALDTDDAWARLSGNSSGDAAGRELAGLGDFDGDGVDDFVIGAPTGSDVSTRAGSAYLVSGADLAAGPGDSALSSAAYAWHGPTAFDFIGSGVGAAGDVDGDGLADLLVGATGVLAAGRGAVYLVLGEAGLSPGGEATLTAVADAALLGAYDSGSVGDTMGGLGDIDGDGLDDFAVGSPLASPGGAQYAGEAYLFVGLPSGSGALPDLADLVLRGPDANDRLGAAVQAGGDADGDGYGDILIGVPRDDEGGADAGAVHLLPGGDLGALAGADLNAVAWVTVRGATAGDGLGATVSRGVDWDADGDVDLLVGLAAEGPDNQGRAWLFESDGLLTAAGAVWTLDDARAVWTGEATGDRAGSAVRFVGDLFGVGGSAIGVAAQDADPGGARDAGRVYLVDAVAD